MVWQKRMARKPDSKAASSHARRGSDAGRRSSLSKTQVLPSDSEANDEARDEEEDLGEWEPDEAVEASSLPEALPAPNSTHLRAAWNTALESSSLSDPLRRYLEEVRRYPMLDPATEMTLAERMIRLNDIEAAKALVQANLRLVVKIAFEYQNFTTNLLDMIQEGNIGLMKAVSKYDPAKNVKLGYYATWWIRSYILKYLLDNFRMVKIGTTQAQKKLFYHLMREKQRLEAQGLYAGPKLLAERLDVREKDVIEMEQRLSGRGAELSIDSPIESSSSEGASAKTFKDSLVDPHENQEQRLEKQQWLKLLENELPFFKQELNEKELRILDERLLSDEPKTLQEIADRYGLTRERARQIEAKLLEKLRARLKEHLSK
ncbi:MAG: RNA polymerase factor sigma-32 [Bdellovibrionales bacterium]|nr:RNA polymerase factor sigma-32 [Bdellovibrionales bacterium]